MVLRRAISSSNEGAKPAVGSAGSMSEELLASSKIRALVSNVTNGVGSTESVAGLTRISVASIAEILGFAGDSEREEVSTGVAEGYEQHNS